MYTLHAYNGIVYSTEFFNISLRISGVFPERRTRVQYGITVVVARYANQDKPFFSQLQDLLRFLSGDAKIPLATAMGYAKNLASSKLMRYLGFSPSFVTVANEFSAAAIAELKQDELSKLIDNADHRKAITNAAKKKSKVLMSDAAEC